MRGELTNRWIYNISDGYNRKRERDRKDRRKEGKKERKTYKQIKKSYWEDRGTTRNGEWRIELFLHC